jgi:hypothetical protein
MSALARTTQNNGRKPMRRFFIGLLSAVLILCGMGASSAPASTVEKGGYTDITFRLEPSQGYHNNTFYSCTVDNRRARIYMRYIIGDGAVTNSFTLDEFHYETAWNSHPAFNANAVRIRWTPYPNQWSDLDYYPWGQSSTTLDDMPSEYWRIYSGEPGFIYQPGFNPLMTIRVWGVGAGAATTACNADGTYSLE